MLLVNCFAAVMLGMKLTVVPQTPIPIDGPKKPSVDRSAEPELKKVFEAIGKLKNIHLIIMRNVRDEDIGAMYPDVNREIWYETPSKFRYETFGYWGDSTCYIADGQKVIVDGRDGEVPIVYRDLKDTIYESSFALNQQGNDVTLASFLLAGEKGMSALVQKDGFIKPAKAGPNEIAVTFQTTLSGTATFYWNATGEPLVSRIEYDNRQFYIDQHNQYPDWFPEPVDPLTRENLTWISVGKAFDKGMFVLPNRPGMTIDDQRTKKS